MPAYNLAVIHIALNDEEVAMRYMQQAYKNRDWPMVVLAVEPRLDPLRRDPRFQEISAKLNLPVKNPLAGSCLKSGPSSLSETNFKIECCSR